jgi:hypothetical protein
VILRVQENKMSKVGGPALAQLVESLRQKVAGSIPDDIIENFHRINPSSRAVALEPNQPLRGLCIRLVPRADKFTTFLCRFSRNLGVSTSWNP